ncbi:uncharacterized protein LOC125238543 [Leguminivora glycinivorella]|uniref:uncharacterized protein LOC125238543 n=1 Tax=Leguminivora glycinivorella TaxID=1035111 RepID=UPI00200BEED5|nr:uncharacterized protein LOC125238543 [Leguminivora glycinivorella]
MAPKRSNKTRTKKQEKAGGCFNDYWSILRLRGGNPPPRDTKGRFVSGSAPDESTEASTETSTRSQMKKENRGSLPDLRVSLTRCDERPGLESDSSAATMETVSSRENIIVGKYWRKGEKRPADDGISDTDSDVAPVDEMLAKRKPFLKAMSKRGRGRPPTTGEYVGFGKLQAELSAEKARLEQLNTEQALAAFLASSEEAARDRSARLMNRQSQSPDCSVEMETAVAIEDKVRAALNAVTHVMSKSGHLKGTYQKLLKDSVTTLGGAFAELRSRTTSDEVARLEAANTQLKTQLAELRRQVQEIRNQPAVATDAEIKKIVEEALRSSTAQFSNMLNARLEGIECRLLPEPRLRPPLASDRREEQDVSGHPELDDQSNRAGEMAAATQPATSGVKQGAKSKTRRKKTTLAAKEAAGAREVQQESTAAAAAPTAPAAAPANPPSGSWKDALGRKAKKAKKPTAPATQASKPARKRKLQPPRTAAVTLTLKQEAVDTGVKYETILAEAKKKIKLEEIGISSVRFRTTATGARMLELPADTKEIEVAADALAAKLREVLDPNMVHIQRPIKCADIRVMGLDDSATAEEVVAAVAELGNCAAEAVKSGVISRSQNGSGTLWLSCPVAAAKKVVEAGRLKVGWISARVVLLDTKPLRCYRCLETGHVGAKCEKGIDRSNICYRCGESGHKSRECSAQPSCAVCKAAGKPADHPIGGKGCQNNKVRPNKQAVKKTGAGQETPPPSQQNAVPETMDTAQ